LFGWLENLMDPAWDLEDRALNKCTLYIYPDQKKKKVANIFNVTSYVTHHYDESI